MTLTPYHYKLLSILEDTDTLIAFTQTKDYICGSLSELNIAGYYKFIDLTKESRKLTFKGQIALAAFKNSPCGANAP
jgi:hypothetical protein